MEFSPTMNIIAHRGASHDAPENTLAAVDLAWEQHADGIEVDVQLTHDRELVLLHDDNFLRTAGTDVLVSELDWETTQQLDVGVWKGEAWTGERVPRLAEVLGITPPGKKVFIELKCGDAAVPTLATVLKRASLNDEQLAVVSDNLPVLASVACLIPAVETYWIVNLRHYDSRANDPGLSLELAERVTQAGLTGLGPRCMDFVDQAFLAPMRERDQKLFVWTVDDPREARRMKDLGVEALVTNRPGWLADQLAL